MLGGLKRLLTGTSRRETSRAEMDEALKRLVVPELRSQGFKGSMPHLRRPRDGEWDLLTFQYSKWGGAFAVEVACCRPEGVNAPTGHVPAEKAKAWDLPRRHRVGAVSPGNDYWFKFEHDDPDAVAQRFREKFGTFPGRSGTFQSSSEGPNRRLAAPSAPATARRPCREQPPPLPL